MQTPTQIPYDLRAVIDEIAGPNGPEQRFDVADRRVEYDAIVELMVRERTNGLDPGVAARVAGAVAAGCFGEQHLWRDMGLADRATLRRLLEAHFAPFAEQNHRDMRWKKYIYRRLCRWEGFHACKAPTCGECSSYAECFAPEE